MNGIHFHTYELEKNRIITVLRVENEVWLSELSSETPEAAASIRDILEGQDAYYRIRPEQIKKVELLEAVPPGTRLQRGDLAPFRRIIYDAVDKLRKVARGSMLVSAGTMAFGSLLIAPVLPIAFPMAFESAKIAASAIFLGSAGLTLGLEAIQVDKVRSGYVRFHAQCSDRMPKHKEILAHAEFVGTMKKKHFEKLCKKLETLDLDAALSAVEGHA